MSPRWGWRDHGDALPRVCTRGY